MILTPADASTNVATVTVALAGNPNAGKSTVFNALTGARQHVGNWPGKTVDKKEGRVRLGGQEIVVVDLPGAYSLTAYSVEEIITRDFLLDEHPDAVIAVLDAANLERNLYLVVQLIELGAPVIVVLNMMDVAEGLAMRIDREALSAALGGAPVVATIARTGVGLEALKAALAQVLAQHNGERPRPYRLDYGEVLEREIAALESRIAQTALAQMYPARWLAVKLLEGEADIAERIRNPILLDAARQAAGRIADACGEDTETLIVDRRYAFIADVARHAVARPTEDILTPSDRIDAVLTHRWLGLPIFLVLMWAVFQLVANVSAPLVDWVDATINGPIAGWLAAVLGVLGLHGTWVEALLVEGVLVGVGGVLVFLPVLFLLYTAIGLLEDTGYMARAAFVMDRFMHALGLHGKSFLPLLIGFGCTVPAIYATRALDSVEDRKLTAFLTTFMSCGARLPVYVIFGSAFFGASAGNLIFALYLVGIGVAVLTGLLLRQTVFKTKRTPPFVMELPPYRMPTFKSLWAQVRERSANFVRTVWTTILAASVVLWFLLAIPVGAGAFRHVSPADSLFGSLSRVISPVFAPAGFGNWEAAGSLVSGLVAKEVVISTLSQIYVGAESEPPADPTTTLGEDLVGMARGLGEAILLTGQELVNIVPRTVNLIPGVAMPEADFLGAGAAEETSDTALATALRERFSPLAAVAFNVFILLYVPCMSSTAVMRREFGGRWTLFQLAYTLIVAWGAATLVYQVGLLLGLG